MDVYRKVVPIMAQVNGRRGDALLDKSHLLLFVDPDQGLPRLASLGSALRGATVCSVLSGRFLPYM